MTTTKKTASHASTTTHAASTTPAQPPVATTPEAPPPQPGPTPLATGAATALALITQAQNALPLTAGLGEKARRGAIRLQIIPTAVLTEVATFLAANAGRYPMFDPQLAQNAAQLEQSLDAVVAQAAALTSRVQNTILEQRGPAIEQALALSAMLRAQSRHDASVRAVVAQMEPLVNTPKTPHQTKLQREKAAAKKKAQLLAPPASPAAATPTPTSAAPPTPVSSGAPAPAAVTHA